MPRRFDTAFMHPPASGGAPDATLLAAVRAWCEAGAFAPMSLPLAVARVAPHASLDAVAGELDGSHALARLGRWRGLAWRLALWLRAPRPEDPWDCGWWRDDPAAAAAFRPRRPTLLLVREPAPRKLAALLDTLRGSTRSYSLPLRVLVVSALEAAEAPTIAPLPHPGDPA
ncbi:MAG: hypothetical protein JNM33_17765 [Rubrivivax sp.]|nr:hypothetical protein [Rubrivivax sp.]